jgi:hypothetical protein
VIFCDATQQQPPQQKKNEIHDHDLVHDTTAIKI